MIQLLGDQVVARELLPAVDVLRRTELFEAALRNIRNRMSQRLLDEGRARRNTVETTSVVFCELGDIFVSPSGVVEANLRSCTAQDANSAMVSVAWGLMPIAGEAPAAL